MMVASEAEDAWCPPTFNPSALSRRWLALWIVQLASHNTLRSSAERISRRSDCGIGALAGGDADYRGIGWGVQRAKIKRRVSFLAFPPPCRGGTPGGGRCCSAIRFVTTATLSPSPRGAGNSL